MLEKIAAFAALHASQAPTAPARFMVTDSEALQVAAEATLAGQKFRNPIGEVAADLEAALKEPPPTETDALVAWATRVGAASRAFWDAFAGEVINGVEIIRKPQ